MSEFEVNKIFDEGFLTILRQVKKFKKSTKLQEYSLKVALVGTGSLQFAADVLQYGLYLHGIKTKLFVGTYNGLIMDALDDESNFNKFNPDITIIFSNYKEVQVYPELFSDYNTICEMAKSQVENLVLIWNKINATTGSQIFQTNYVIPIERQLGNLEGNHIWSHQSYLQRVNWELMNIKPSYVTILDFEYLAAKVGKQVWFDDRNYYLNKCNMSYECLPLAIKEILMNILNYRGITKKCIVLDLDNTLWGGVLEECGINGVNLDPNDPIGEAYIGFQKYLKWLKDRGIILAVCSKNDEQYAKRVFVENSNMVLSLEDISCFIANWEDKHRNVKKISETLNLGLSALIFVDDNEVERGLIKSALPEVEIVDIGEDPSEFVNIIESGMYFEWLQITEEDTLRNNTYSIQTTIDENSHMDKSVYENYLIGLHMSAQIGQVDKTSISRVVQLFNKTNQFNSTGYRCTEGGIYDLKREGKQVYWCKLTDQYNKYGVISCFIVKFRKDECIVEAWCMSCRVFKRGVEQLIIDYLMDEALKHGCSVLKFLYVQTERNHLVKEIMLNCGIFKEKVEDMEEWFVTEIKEQPRLQNFITLNKEKI